MFRQTAAENVALGLRAAGGEGADGRVRAAMERLCMGALRDEPARRHVLVLDEFTANLDPANVTLLEREVQPLASQGASVVLATHDLAQAGRLADRVALLLGGRVAEQGPANSVLTHPTSADARAFLCPGT